MKQLTLIEKAFFLKKVKIFEDLDLDFLLSISDKVHQDEYDKNEPVFLEKQIGHSLYLIAKGSVELIKGAVRRRHLKVGDFFGDESLFNERPRAYAAACTTDTLLLILSRSDLMSIISECPNVAVQLLKHYTEIFHTAR
ncbi:MAG: cyclic nucleotide-binding domain-containing protein [Chlamydiota bacterium]